MGLFYRHKAKAITIGIFCMIFLFGYRIIGLYELNKSEHLARYDERFHHPSHRNQKNINSEDLLLPILNLSSLNNVNNINNRNSFKKNERFSGVDPIVKIQEPINLLNKKINNVESVAPVLKKNENILSNLQRIVHIDLKGAPPKSSYFEKFIPFLKQNGAHGILLEYEDMFPFEGELKDARHGLAYTLKEVDLIKNLAKQNGLYIIPLVQTYGHLEWLLKVKKFAHLREHPEFPQVITPCMEASYTVLYDMLDQVINQFKDVPYFHIGCDEVYYKLINPSCNNHPFKNDFTRAFMSHLIKIATYVKKKLPEAKIIFWDDMLHGMDEQILIGFKKEIIDLGLEVMMWGYMEDVKSYFSPNLYQKYGNVFGSIWIATAYKGASGELAYFTSIQHHYLNHISWINVMKEKVQHNIVNFKGVAFTGWSRYDHFLVLCELLPQAIPSLIFNMHVMQIGELNEDKKQEITNTLGCNGAIPWNGVMGWSTIACKFPGHEIYEVIITLDQHIQNLKPNLDFAEKYLSNLQLNFNYIHKQRSIEVKNRLNQNYQALNSFRNKFIQASQSIYYNDTIAEWLEVYFMPHFEKVYNKLIKLKQIYSENDWKPRPLPIELKQYPDYI